MSASALSAGRKRLASCLWVAMPFTSVGIWENQRSGTVPPAAIFTTAPKPAAEGKTGSQGAVGHEPAPVRRFWIGGLRPW